jgi:phosphate transport system ATP-binding protein
VSDETRDPRMAPPARRIVLDQTPTTVAPPGGPQNGHSAAPAPQAPPQPGGQPLPRPPAAQAPALRGFYQTTERMRAEGLSIDYGAKRAVNEVDLPVRQGEVLALIGPSGCGKTTLLRSLNRLVDLTASARRSGRILLDDEDVDLLDVTRLRRRVGMLFQQPNPFPMSIFDNVAYGLRNRGSRRPSRRQLESIVIESLERAGLLDEVKDNLNHPALALSGGQQQRLCIARSLAVKPEVLLLDEPCSALDPLSTAVIEETVTQLRADVAIVIVTHNLQQAQRIADQVAFMYLGDLIEYGPAGQIFGAPRAERTRAYVSGSFG